ncbi:MAG TPA: 23S rRNA (adenine(2503)-C(2))-methyltransferase RlmN, partial [Myxococcota bacterium]|nr:23S rRNA (adenine(2503)-C(2))-methyltransferase RlmN [Myxococcota bacterium]
EKLVLALRDGARVESVLVPMPGGRTTLCVSTQVGCAMGCAFCATGTLGLGRHMAAGEIVAQVHAARASVGRPISRLVFMGMGEPLHNCAATEAAVRVLLDDHGLCFGSKQITVSTVGLPDRMRQLAAAFGGRIQLALSLHAGTDAVRQQIVPMARKAPLSELRDVIRAWPLPGSRAIMVEYVVLPGVNDGPGELDGVAWFMEGVRGVVNLIPYNPFPGGAFRSPEDDEVRAAFTGLRERGVLATIRWPRGRGAFGACGQLAGLGG